MTLRRSQESSLAEELPYWEFLEEPFSHLCLIDGSMVTGLSVSLADIECREDGEINHLTEGLRSLLNSLPEGLTIQFHYQVSSDFKELISKHEGLPGEFKCTHPLIAELAQERIDRLKSDMEIKRLFKPELKVYMRLKPKELSKRRWFQKQEHFVRVAALDYSEALEELCQAKDGFASALIGLGFEVGEISKDEMASVVYRFFNPKRSMDEPTPKLQSTGDSGFDPVDVKNAEWLAYQSPRGQLLFGDLILGAEQFVLDGYATQVITLKTLPETTFAGQLSSFLKLNCHYELLLSFHVPPQSGEMAKLHQRRRMAHSLATTQGGKASDLESESKLSSAEELIRELLSSGQHIFATQMTIILRAPNHPLGHRQLSRDVREVLSQIRSLGGAEGLQESVGAWKVLKGNLPAAPLSLERARKMKTNNLADFLPLYGPRLGDPTPAVVLKNRSQGLVAYDPFGSELPNYNCLVTGASGSGKSFLNNCLLLQELSRGLRVFVIDIGASYKKLTEAINGEYLEISLSDSLRLNPFHINDPYLEPSSHKIKSILAVLESMVSEDDQTKLSRLDRSLLEKAVIELYQKKRAKGKVPTLSDLVTELKTMNEPSMIVLSKLLYSWTGDRPYGKLLDGEGSLDTKAQITTFDLKGLSSYPDLQRVMILILTDFILSELETDPSTRKRIILDEAWELLKTPASANFMEYCARTLRKTGSGITFITQGVDEIVSSPIGSALLNNTATKYILLQRGDTATLQNALKLNTKEVQLIDSLSQCKGQYSEAFMSQGHASGVIRVCPTPLEYWLATSDSRDNLHLSELRALGHSLEEALRLAAKSYPEGFTKGIIAA